MNLNNFKDPKLQISRSEERKISNWLNPAVKGFVEGLRDGGLIFLFLLFLLILWGLFK